MDELIDREPRDSLIVVSWLRVEGKTYPVVVRNISSLGLKAVGDAPIGKGSLVEVDVKNLGWVQGKVAWIKGKEFGVRLRTQIQPEALRRHISTPGSQPGFEARTPRFV